MTGTILIETFETHVKQIFTISLLLLFTFCSQPESPIVAQFGTQTITLEEFRIAYLDVIKHPNTYDSPELREKFLDEMIRQRLLAEAARRQGLPGDERLEYQLTAYHEKCLREAHFQQIIRPQIEITDDDIAEVYQFTQEQRRIQHLFVSTRTQADSLYQYLERGVPFDTLARLIYPDSSVAPSGGDLGWVHWDQLEYDLAMTAFRQPAHTYSKPVKSRFGYHIIRVLDSKKNPLITRQQYQAHYQKAKYLLEQKRGEALANDYIEKMMAGKSIQVYPNVLEFVGKQLGDKFERAPSPFDGMKPMQLSETERQRIENDLWEYRREVMATIDGQPYTIGQFIGALNYVPYTALQQSFKTALDILLRDFVLTEEAKASHFDQIPAVQLRTRLYEDYLLQLKLRRQLVRDVRIDETEIQAAYDAQKASKYQNVTYAVAKPLIKKQLRNEKKARHIPDVVEKLSAGLTIEKYPERIHAYYDAMLK